MTSPATTATLALLTEYERCALLNALTEWANTPAGREYRSELAADPTQLSPTTAEDVLATLDDKQAEDLRLLFSM